MSNKGRCEQRRERKSDGTRQRRKNRTVARHRKLAFIDHVCLSQCYLYFQRAFHQSNLVQHLQTTDYLDKKRNDDKVR